ncbi:MAG TPA: hypothetical protein VL866_24120 [Pyrinomonadaceae bacterium]|nr:hypothetical protein [Pyrinomonadaceae bacterium]
MADIEISETSKVEARVFARLHKLDQRSEWALAQLLEKVWQDGCQCERTMQFLERDIIPNVNPVKQ